MSLGLLSRRRVLILVGVIIVAPVVYWLASPLVISVHVSEAPPQVTNGQPTILRSGTFTDADSFHRTSGIAKILQLPDGSRVLRLENFKTTNGPDLFVYLSVDKQAKDFLNLSSLKGNIGDQNYAIPADADLPHYRYVLIWCRAFSILFGSAELA